MKKRFLALLLSLALTLSLAAPALADMGYVPLDTSPEWLAWKETWTAAHPDLWAAFDPDLWFDQHYTDYYASPEEFMELSQITTREDFEAHMAQAWLQAIQYDDEQRPAAEEYAAAHPEEYAAFDPDAWVAESWYTDRAGYKTMWQVDDAIFEAFMWSEYAGGRLSEEADARRVEDYRAAHPGELEALDLEAMLDRWGYRDPWTAYMEDFSYQTEEEAREALLYDYVLSREQAAYTLSRAESYRAADPESWAAFDPDAYLAQEYPWYDKDSFMADRRLLTDEEYAAQLYTEFMSISSVNWLTPGDPTLVVNGLPSDLPFTTADGVSYLSAADAKALFGGDYTGESVPLRSAAEDAGYDVVWNSYQNQIVLLNQGQLFQDLGLDFSGFDALMNRILDASATEPGQSYRTTETAKLSFTAFNTLDGDQTYTATVKADMVSRDNVYDLTLTMKAADLLGLVPPAALEKLTAQMPKLTLKDLKTLLGGLELRVLLDLESGSLSWNCPLLSLLDEAVTEDTWYTLDLGTEAADPALDALASGTWDTGAFLYAALLADSENSYLGAMAACSSFIGSSSMMMGMFGPSTITEKNGGITWSMDADRMNEIIAQAMASVSYGGDWSGLKLFKEYDLSVSIDKSGKMTSSMACRLDMDALAAAATSDEWYDAGTAAALSWVMGLLDFRMAAQAQGTAAKSTGTAEFHWKNQFKLEVESTSTRKETTDLPLTLPSNAKIIPSKLLG